MGRSAVSAAILVLVLAAFPACGEEPKKDAPVARVVYYSGRVQGVGFRDTALAISRDHAVTGYVKNLDDGRVELVVEGTEEVVKKFLEAIRTRWKKNIEKEQVDERKPTGTYKDFRVMR